MNSDKFLVDTTIWVKFFRGEDERLKERLSSLVLQNQACISEIIIMEILRGARSEKEYKMLYDDFMALPLLSINKNVWELAWEMVYKLKKKGITIPLADVIISSTALYYNCTLIHSDKHFDLVSKYLKLRTIKV
jgi:hypothetical protein